MRLNSAQKRYLRGLTHHIKPVVMVGEKGLSETVLQELQLALEHHELIKVKLRADRAMRKSMSGAIAKHCDATLVHQIGQMSCFYRRNPERPVVNLPNG